MVLYAQHILLFSSFLFGCSSLEKAEFIYIDNHQNEFFIFNDKIVQLRFSENVERNTNSFESISLSEIQFAQIKTLLVKAKVLHGSPISIMNERVHAVLHFTNEDDYYIFDHQSLEQLAVDWYLDSIFKAQLSKTNLK